jgi:hypothetical protein
MSWMLWPPRGGAPAPCFGEPFRLCGVDDAREAREQLLLLVRDVLVYEPAQLGYASCPVGSFLSSASSAAVGRGRPVAARLVALRLAAASVPLALVRIA